MYTRQAIDRLVWIKDINLILDSNKKNHIDTLKSMYKKGQTLYLSRGILIIIVLFKKVFLHNLNYTCARPINCVHVQLS